MWGLGWLEKSKDKARALAGVGVRSGSCSFFWYPLTDLPEPTLPSGSNPTPRAARQHALRDGSLLAFLQFAHVPWDCVGEVLCLAVLFHFLRIVGFPFLSASLQLGAHDREAPGFCGSSFAPPRSGGGVRSSAALLFPPDCFPVLDI